MPEIRACPQSLLHRAAAPLADGADLALDSFVALGQRNQILRRVRSAGQNHVLHGLFQLRFNLVVHRQHPGIDDAHVQPGADGVVEKDRVHRFPHVIVASKAERYVADTARDFCARQLTLDPAGRLDKVQRVAVMLAHPGGHRQHIGIKNDVLRRKIGLLGQQLVGRVQISLRRSKLSACPVSSKAITTAAAP